MSEQFVQSLKLTDLQFDDRGFLPRHRDESQSEGFSDATKAPLPDMASQDDPYARGLLDGQKMAQVAYDLERQRLQELVASAQALQAEPSDELAVLIGEAVEMLVTQIVGKAAVDHELLTARARQAANLVADCDAARTMWVHPDDLDLLDPQAFAIPLMADPEAERGSIRIDCSAGWIEHGTALYLDQLRIELGLFGENK
ncbi:MAG: flagellar biosynthetic protein [Sphingorhabdus sp.]